MMTSIKESIRRLLYRSERLDAVSSDFAYRVFWTGEVRKWEENRIAEVHAALEEVIIQDNFNENEVMRKYHLPELDREAHSGVSLRALSEVLEAFK